MNEQVALRNFPKPSLSATTPDCGLSQRREVIAQVCERVNELVEYVYGLDTEQALLWRVTAPGQSNIDERMPTSFLRPCIHTLNGIVEEFALELDPMPQIGNGMDYHGFILWVNRIVSHMNEINGALQ
jgi:hypothetical protein